jgi:hypothetical protein
MADDPTQQAQDRQRINVNQEHECRYWTEKFGIDADRLREVVKKVGPMVSDVERELASKG